VLIWPTGLPTRNSTRLGNMGFKDYMMAQSDLWNHGEKGGGWAPS